MKNILPALSVLAMLSCTAATTQITAAQSVEPAASSTSSSPVAYVYVPAYTTLACIRSTRLRRPRTEVSLPFPASHSLAR